MLLVIEVDENEYRQMKNLFDPAAKFYLHSVSGDGTEEENVRITMMGGYDNE